MIKVYCKDKENDCLTSFDYLHDNKARVVKEWKETKERKYKMLKLVFY